MAGWMRDYGAALVVGVLVAFGIAAWEATAPGPRPPEPVDFVFMELPPDGSTLARDAMGRLQAGPLPCGWGTVVETTGSIALVQLDSPTPGCGITIVQPTGPRLREASSVVVEAYVFDNDGRLKATTNETPISNAIYVPPGPYQIGPEPDPAAMRLDSAIEPWIQWDALADARVGSVEAWVVDDHPYRDFIGPLWVTIKIVALGVHDETV